MNEIDKVRMYASTMNRRQLLRYGIAGSVTGIAGCLGNNNGGSGSDTNTNKSSTAKSTNGSSSGQTSGSDADYSQKVTLKAAGPTIGLPAEDPTGKTFMQEYNVDFQLKSVPATPSDMVQLFVAGNGAKQFDTIWDNGGGMEELLAPRDALSPIDKSKIPTWNNLNSAFQQGGYLHDTLTSGGKLYGTPSARNADSIAYLKDEIDKPDSWGVVFDDQYKGKVAIVDDYANVPHWTGLYLRENGKGNVHNSDLLSSSDWQAVNSIQGNEINNLDEKQLKAVIKYLIGQKKMGQFRSIWTSFGNVSSMLGNGEVVAAYAYEPSVVALQDQGVNIGYPKFREGHLEWDDNWWMTSGAAGGEGEEAYYRMATYSCTAKYGAQMNDTQGFSTGLSSEKCLKYMKDQGWSDERYQKNKAAFDAREARFNANGKVHAWNNPDPDILDKYLDEWNRFVNA